jgi:hypothetical protein
MLKPKIVLTLAITAIVLAATTTTALAKEWRIGKTPAITRVAGSNGFTAKTESEAKKQESAFKCEKVAFEYQSATNTQLVEFKVRVVYAECSTKVAGVPTGVTVKYRNAVKGEQESSGKLRVLAPVAAKEAGQWRITLRLNNVFKVRINGTTCQIIIPAGTQIKFQLRFAAGLGKAELKEAEIEKLTTEGACGLRPKGKGTYKETVQFKEIEPK